ncbi:autolysin, partial [Staphylococcus gallinarum]
TAFQEAARMLKKWGLPVNRETVRLHNEFSPTECPHRSMELHAGYYSSQMAPDSVKKKTKDYFISQIKAYYNGEIPKGSTDK